MPGALNQATWLLIYQQSHYCKTQNFKGNSECIPNEISMLGSGIMKKLLAGLVISLFLTSVVYSYTAKEGVSCGTIISLEIDGIRLIPLSKICI